MKTLLSTLLLAFALCGSTVFADAPTPVNDVCPICGKAGRLIYRSNYKGQHVIFHTAECKDKFDKNPGGFKVTPKKD
jgi:YHS domain-containing protein